MATSTIKGIGTTINGTTLASSVATGVKTNCKSVELTKGVWIVTYNAGLQMSANKQCQVTLTEAGKSDHDAVQEFSGQFPRIAVTGIFAVSESTTVYGTVYHNNGNTPPLLTNEMRAVRIA